MAYVSLTLLNVKSVFSYPRFLYHANRSRNTALASNGLIDVSIKGFSLLSIATKSLWDNQDVMIAFLKHPAHVAAVENLNKIGNGFVYGYQSDRLPEWQEAKSLLLEKGRPV